MQWSKKNRYWMGFLLFPAAMLLQMHVLHHDAGLSTLLALEDALASVAILALAVWGIQLVIRAYPTTAGIYIYAVGASLVISLIAVFVQTETLRWWPGTGETTYQEWVVRTVHVRFLFTWLLLCWLSTSGALRKVINLSESRFQLQTDASELLKEAELFKLRQQHQPHFLYNSLNSINALVLSDPDKAQEMIGKLSAFLRSSIRRESEDLLPVAEELEYLQAYLDIESVRFGDRLHVVIDNQADPEDRIPPFLLQPILENAIKFGLYGKTGRVDIQVQILSANGLLDLRITNPYDPDTQPPRGTGFGLEGIGRRLWLLFARNDLLETRRYENTFTTILKIPASHV